MKNERYSTDITPAIIRTNITDHYSLILGTNITNTINKTQKNYFTYEILNKDKLQQLIRRERWQNVYTSENAETATDAFVKKLQDCIRAATATIEKTMKPRKREWITNGLIASIKQRDQLRQKSLKFPENQTLKTEYKNYRNKLNSLIRKTKFNFYKNKIIKNSQNSKEMWKTIKEYAGNDPKRQNIDGVEQENGNLVYDRKDIAECFNVYFANVGKDLATKLKNHGINEPATRRQPQSMYLAETDPSEVTEIITELKSKKAPGPDKITNDILKSISEHVARPLSFIINKCFATGDVPTHFKNAIIIPIYKNGDKRKVNNYRPISLTSTISKIFEKILKLRMTNYLDKYKLIAPSQFGFRDNLSTQDAIAAISYQINQAMDKRKACLGIFIDLAKAFDTVCHKLLLKKLECLGFRGSTYRLLENFLTNRKQRVRIGDDVSSEMDITYGVPQGTVLGPVLFIIYINEILTRKNSGTIISFADDTAIIYTGESWRQVRETAENDLENVFEWFRCSVLTVNVEKTKVVPFTSYESNLPNYDTLTLNGVGVPLERSVRYLGICVDSFLRWDVHTANVVKKIRGLIYRFWQFKRFLGFTHLKILYHALVESIIQYGIVGWGGILSCHLKPLEVLQKWFIKIILGKPRTYPTDQLFSESQLLDFRQLFCKNILQFISEKKTYIHSANHKYPTRNNKGTNMFMPRANKSVGQRCFSYLAPRLLRLLPDELQGINSKSLFKKRLKRWLLNTDKARIHSIINC